MAQRRSNRSGKGRNSRISPQPPRRRRPGPSNLSHSHSATEHPLSDDLETLGIGPLPGQSTINLAEAAYHHAPGPAMRASSATQLIEETRQRQDLGEQGGPQSYKGPLEDDDRQSGDSYGGEEVILPSSPPVKGPDCSLLTPTDTLRSLTPQSTLLPQPQLQPSRARTHISETPQQRPYQRRAISSTPTLNTTRSQRPASSLPGRLSTPQIRTLSPARVQPREETPSALEATALLIICSIYFEDKKISDVPSTHEAMFLDHMFFEELALNEAVSDTNKPREVLEVNKYVAELQAGPRGGKIPFSWRTALEYTTRSRVIDTQQTRIGPTTQMTLSVKIYVVTKAAFAAQLAASNLRSADAQQPSTKRRRTATEDQLEEAPGRAIEDRQAGSWSQPLFEKWKCRDSGCAVNGKGGMCWIDDCQHFQVDDKQAKQWARAIGSQTCSLHQPPYSLGKLLIKGGPSRRKNESERDFKARYNRNIQAAEGLRPLGNQGGSNDRGTGPLVSLNFGNGSENDLNTLFRGNLPARGSGPSERSSPPVGDTDPDQRMRDFFDYMAVQAPARRERYQQIADRFVDEFYNLQGVKYYVRDHRNLANSNPMDLPRGLLNTLEADVRRFERERPVQARSPCHQSAQSDGSSTANEGSDSQQIRDTQDIFNTQGTL